MPVKDPTQPTVLSDGRLYIPAGFGRSHAYITDKTLPSNWTFEGVLPDGRVAIRVAPEEGQRQKGQYKFVRPERLPKFFRKPELGERIERAFDLPLKLAGVRGQRSEEPTAAYVAKMAVPASQIAAGMLMGPIGTAAVEETAGLGTRVLQAVAPTLKRAGLTTAIGMPFALAEQYLSGEKPSPLSAAGRALGESVQIPIAESVAHGVLSSLGRQIRPFYGTTAQYGEQIAKPENLAYSELMGEHKIPTTLGEITQDIARQKRERRAIVTGAGEQAYKELQGKQATARKTAREAVVRPLERGTTPGTFRMPGSMTVGAEVQRPLKAIQQRIVDLETELAATEEKVAAAHKSNAAIEKANARTEALNRAAVKKGIAAAEKQNIQTAKANEALVTKHAKGSEGYPTSMREADVREVRAKLEAQNLFKKPVEAHPEAIERGLRTRGELGTAQELGEIPEGFSKDKAKELATLRKLLDPERFPKLQSLLTAEDPGDAAKAIYNDNPAEMVSYMELLSNKHVRKMFTEKQLNRATDAVRLAYVRNVLGIPEGGGPIDSASILKRMGLDTDALVDIANRKYNSNKIPAIVKDFLVGDEQGESILNFLATEGWAAERQGGLAGHTVHPHSARAFMWNLMKNVAGGATGIAKRTFTPEGQEWLRYAMRKAENQPAGTIPNRIIRGMELFYLAKKAEDARFGEKPTRAEKPSEAMAIEQAAGGM